MQLVHPDEIPPWAVAHDTLARENELIALRAWAEAERWLRETLRIVHACRG
jgi:hypothetical protein